MMRRRRLFIPTLAFLFCSLGAGVGLADVTIKGKVRYWDRIAGTWKPARQVRVEVEGDWWGFDPQVVTNNNGDYIAQYRDPYWGTFDINIEVYAMTPDLIEVYEDVFEAFFEMYPYHAASAEHKGVNGGETCTINLDIGEGGNAVSVWTRTLGETANAFLVHQEMLAHVENLQKLGFLPADFDEFEAIVPAVGVGSAYYNHFTNYINFWVESAGNTGLGNWTNLNANPSWSGHPYFLDTVRHEYSHAIHDAISSIFTPFGLNIPATHSPKTETNRWLAFTEGWAEFLPLVTIGSAGKFEPTAGLGIPASEPPGGHYAWEGEVAALLWDIHDGPLGQVETLRHPVKWTSDGKALPQPIVDAQVWRDRLTDFNLAKTKQVACAWSLTPPWPVDTIEEFLDIYRKLNPGELHGLKTAAFNRDISNSMPLERPASVVGSPKVWRDPGGGAIVQLMITEPDPEDRAFVEVWVWRQVGSGKPQSASVINIPKEWQGDRREVNLIVSAPAPAGGQSDILWIVVSDEMLPTAFTVDNPAASVTALQPRVYPVAPIVHAAPVAEHVQAAELKAAQRDKIVFNREVGLAQGTKGEAGADNLRTKILEGREILRGHGERMELVRREERALLGAARRLDDLAVQGEAVKRAQRPSLRRQVSAADQQSLFALRQWVDKTAAGGIPKRPLPKEAAQDFQKREAALSNALAAHPSAASRAPALAAQLRAAFQAQQFTPEMEAIRSDTERVVNALESRLKEMASDNQLAPRLAAERDAIRTLIMPSIKSGSLPSGLPNLTGQWNSNIGAVYEIQQSGNNFTWSVPSLKQSGTGTVSGNIVTMSGPGWTVKGTVTETDASGNPTKIVGENGVIIFRMSGGPLGAPAQPPTPGTPSVPPASVGAISDISGQWNSNIGAFYTIQQSGSGFSWSAPSLNQSGTGTVSGNIVTMSGPGWTVKGIITEADNSGRPTKIVGENGVVLFRKI